MKVGGRGMVVGKLARVESRAACSFASLCSPARDDGPPDGDDARRRGGERPPDGDAHPPDASVTVPFMVFLPE